MKRRTLCLWLFFALSVAAFGQRPKVALVLGGGGAKGAATIGVLQSIEESGIPIDMIVGTSAGAMIGALYAGGYDAREIDSLFRAQDWLSLLTDEEDGRIGLPLGVRGDSLVARFSRLLPDYDAICFDSLPIPYRAVCTDLNTFTEYVFAEGNLTIALRASMSAPPNFRPVALDTLMLCDGGLLNNLPVDVARSMGADYVIAIDLINEKRMNQVRVKEMRWKGVPALLVWKIARPDLYKHHNNAADADIYIHPDLEGFKGFNFKDEDLNEMIERGKQAGQEHLDKLKKLRGRVLAEAQLSRTFQQPTEAGRDKPSVARKQ